MLRHAYKAREQYNDRAHHYLYKVLAEIDIYISKALEQNKNICTISWVSLQNLYYYDRQELQDILMTYGYLTEDIGNDLLIKW